MQIDSHMRFVQGWDALLLDQLARCTCSSTGAHRTFKPILTTYPLGYTLPSRLPPHTMATLLCADAEGATPLRVDTEGVAALAARASATPHARSTSHDGRG